MKPIFILYGLMVLLLILSVYTISKNYPFPSQEKSSELKKVCFNQICFNTELAISDEQKIKGLQSRTSFSNDSGMLFIFDKSGIYSFWMKDTLIPLDIIWLDEDKKIVFIKENASPCNENCKTFSPEKEAKYVLEINALQSSLNNLSLGSQAEFG